MQIYQAISNNYLCQADAEEKSNHLVEIKYEENDENDKNCDKSDKRNSGLPNSYPCGQCDYISNGKKDIISHVDTRHGGIFQCAQCDKTFTTYSGFKTHLDNKHSEESYLCDKCNFTTGGKWYLQRHMTSVHADLIFSCDMCSFTAKHKSTVREDVNYSLILYRQVKGNLLYRGIQRPIWPLAIPR